MERDFILLENMCINYRWRIICWMDYIACFSQSILCPPQVYQKFSCLLIETSLPVFVFENYKPLSFCSGILQISFSALHRIQDTVQSALCSHTSHPHSHYCKLSVTIHISTSWSHFISIRCHGWLTTSYRSRNQKEKEITLYRTIVNRR